MLPDELDGPMVLEQLVNGGVIDAIDMHHKGLPDRLEYSAFCTEFKGLIAKDWAKDTETPTTQGGTKGQVQWLLYKLFNQSNENVTYAFGCDRVFMKGAVSSKLRP